MEQVCFELENVEVTFLDRKVLEIDRLAVHQFDRIGIIGKNGAGKSTLIKLLAGIVRPSKGEVKRHVNAGYLEQMEAPEAVEADPRLLGKLHVRDAADGMSGGEQTRLKIAQLFTHYNECLLIDEPTTHLDQEGISFLLDELKHYYGSLVLISHDRSVLDELVGTIWEVDEGKVNVYAGNYSAYMEQKNLEREQQGKAHELYRKEKNRLEKAAREKMKKAEKIAKSSKKEPKAKANRMIETKSKSTSQKAIRRAAKSIEQRAEKLEFVEAPKEEGVIRFRQSKSLELHNKFPIMADRLTLTAGDKLLLSEANFQFPAGRTIAITGNNGTGKTTLLRHILTSGDGLTVSPKVVFGSYEQLGYQFTQDETVVGYVKDRSDYEESEIRSAIHSMGFAGNDLKKNVRHLSGGEAIRLVLCRLFLGRYNVLILDEPTNFLDVSCIEALEQFLGGYEGTVLLVSHDRTFVDRVADDVYVLEEQQLKLH